MGEREAKRQRARIAKLEGQRRRLMHDRYQDEDAIPLDLFKEEQQRITRELAAANQALTASELAFVDIEETFEEVIALASDCERLYRIMPPLVRRQLNRAFFEKVLVDAVEVTGAVLAEPFASVVDLARRERNQQSADTNQPQRSYYRQTQNSALLSSGPSSNETILVGTAGFEPATPCSQSS